MEDFFGTNYTTQWEIVLRYIVAAALGFIAGLDRELKNKPIGARGFMLVSLGAAVFATVTMELAVVYDGMIGVAKVDPSRVIQGVVGGIGFLGAGAIIQSGGDVRGTGTGAGIWCVGGIGIACGFGFYWHAAVATFIAVIILTVVGFIHRKLTGENT
ncbi:MAG: MgtC/SapB family protein [Alphaproteobacteria bacterium]